MSGWNIIADIVALHGSTEFREITTYLYNSLAQNLGEKYVFGTRIPGNKTLIVRCIPISQIDKSGIYPVLYSDIINNDRVYYLYIYVLQTDNPIKYNPIYDYNGHPQYYLTVSNMMTKIKLEKKIENLKKFITANRLPQIDDYYFGLGNMPKPNPKLSPLMSDQEINIIDHIDRIVKEKG